MSNNDYNTLPIAKKLLNNFRDNYCKKVEAASSDLRPDWSNQGFGFNYGEIEDKDRRFIYEAIGTLGPELESSLFEFDIESEFISPKKAVNFLIKRYEIIKGDLEKLIDLKIKYSKDGNTPYPISITINYHQKTVDLLEEVLKLREVQGLLKPGYLESVIEENYQLKFEKVWKNQILKYIFMANIYIRYFFSNCNIITYI